MLSAPGLVPDPPRKDTESLSGGASGKNQSGDQGLSNGLVPGQPQEWPAASERPWQ